MKCPVASDDNLGSPMPTDRPASSRSRLSSSVKSAARISNHPRFASYNQL